MPAVDQDIGITELFVQGDSLTLSAVVYQADGTTPEDISGTAIRWEAHRMIGGVPVGEALVSKSIGSGVTVHDAPGGVFEVAILPADGEDLSGVLYHEAEVTFVGGVVDTILRGRWVVQRAGVKPAA